MPINSSEQHKQELNIVEQVDVMAEEVKILALKLAIYLAKAKPNSKTLNQMEPEFIRLVNGTVKAAQEIGQLIAAARHSETMVYDVPSGNAGKDQMEVRLRSILDQCGRIISSLSTSTDLTG